MSSSLLARHYFAQYLDRDAVMGYLPRLARTDSEPLFPRGREGDEVVRQLVAWLTEAAPAELRRLDEMLGDGVAAAGVGGWYGAAVGRLPDASLLRR